MRQEEAQQSLRFFRDGQEVLKAEEKSRNITIKASARTRLISDSFTASHKAPESARLPIDEQQLGSKERVQLQILISVFGLKHGEEHFKALQHALSKQAEPMQNLSQEASLSGEGMELRNEYHLVDSEYSALHFSGSIMREDGSEITLDFSHSMQRHFETHESLSIRTGAVPIDPLSLDLDGSGIHFNEQQSTHFDLTADGNKEEFASLSSGSAYLALDRNNNGRIDNGHELFGPQSGNGFAELARFDEDHNNIIDENDAIWHKLQVTNLYGFQSSIADSSIGAIFLDAIASPFTHRSSDNSQDLARVRASSFYLREDGSAGLVQHIDLVA